MEHGAGFPCKPAACRAEGQERSGANQLLIGNEHSNRARLRLPARRCCELPATVGCPTASLPKYMRVWGFFSLSLA